MKPQSNRLKEAPAPEPTTMGRGQESKGAIIQEMIPLLRAAAQDPNVTSQEVSVLKQLVTFFTSKAQQADLLKSFNLIKRSFDNISKDLERQVAAQPDTTAVNEVRDYLLTAPPPFKNQKARGNK
jgi:hypothetical protein